MATKMTSDVIGHVQQKLILATSCPVNAPVSERTFKAVIFDWLPGEAWRGSESYKGGKRKLSHSGSLQLRLTVVENKKKKKLQREIVFPSLSSWRLQTLNGTMRVSVAIIATAACYGKGKLMKKNPTPCYCLATPTLITAEWVFFTSENRGGKTKEAAHTTE